ncbi:MAG: hypothetical protein HEQ32_08030 [Vampirovibrio sp.]
MTLNQFSVQVLLLALATSFSAPLFVQADGLVQLRPLGKTSPSTSVSSGKTVQAWQPSTTSSGRIDTSAYDTMPTYGDASASSAPYRTGVSAVAGQQFLTIRLNDRVSSQDSKMGDTVSATLESPMMSGSSILAPAGSEVLGSIVEVSHSKRAGIHGEVDLRFYTIVKPNGERVAIDAIVVTKKGDAMIRPNNYAIDAAKGVGVAAAGTATGALTGLATGAIFGAAGSGAALGTAVGAAAGIGYALWRPGKSIELPKGSLLQLKTQDAKAPQARPI